MAWSVTFGSTTIVSNTSGVYQFTPGIMRRNIVQEQLPYALGELAKDLGLAGCEHTLTVTLTNVATGTSLTTWFTTMQNMISPATGSISSATLTVPDYPAFPNCVCTGIACGPQTQTTSVTAAGYSGTTYNLEFSFTFHQLRR